MFRGSVVSKDHPCLGKCRLRDPCVCREAKHLWQCPEARTNDRNVLQAGGFVIWSLRRRQSWACCAHPAEDGCKVSVGQDKAA